jgi:hypothetical protein
MPTFPGAKQGSGWKPMRHFPMADIMPGQLAPTRRVLDWVFSIEWICLNMLERHSASLAEGGQVNVFILEEYHG